MGYGRAAQARLSGSLPPPPPGAGGAPLPRILWAHGRTSIPREFFSTTASLCASAVKQSTASAARRRAAPLMAPGFARTEVRMTV